MHLSPTKHYKRQDKQFGEWDGLKNKTQISIYKCELKCSDN